MRFSWMMLLIWSAAFGICYGDQPARRLLDVKTVYVDTFGAAPGADLLRESVIGRLAKSGRFEVIEDRQNADAVLVGVGEISKHYKEFASLDKDEGKATGRARGRTIVDATLAVRLMSQERKILWADDARTDDSSYAAMSVVKSLLKAVEKEAKAKQ